MDFLSLLALAAVVIPVWRLITEWREISDGSYWHKVGIVVRSMTALDSVAEVIGRYRDADIYGSVVFKGIRYDFDRVAVPAYKAVMRRRELYLEPGLVYVNR
jgi:hypothetical protein